MAAEDTRCRGDALRMQVFPGLAQELRALVVSYNQRELSYSVQLQVLSTFLDRTQAPLLLAQAKKMTTYVGILAGLAT